MSLDASEEAARARQQADEERGEEFVEFLHDLVLDLEARVEEVEAENADLRETVAHQAELIAKLDERTDIMTLVEEADDIPAKQRRTYLLLHMKRMAEQRAKNGKPKAYTVTQETANEALHGPDIHRTTWYTDFQQIEGWVGNKDVCQYIPDTGGDSRLELDLTNGDLLDQDLPAGVANELRGGD